MLYPKEGGISMTTAVATTLQDLDLTGPVGSLGAYIQAVGSIPVLSKEDEQALARRFREDEDLEAARDAVRQQLGYFPRTPFYARMFASAGFPSSETDGWTNEILDAVLISGDEAAVADRLDTIFDWGATEVLASVVMANGSRDSYIRTLKFLGEYSPS